MVEVYAKTLTDSNVKAKEDEADELVPLEVKLCYLPKALMHSIVCYLLHTLAHMKYGSV